ncbi:hypothetical protein [Streptomyces sp. NPDC058653]|uniref:hypothetical protein n=1 Tax=Streptomyces sp. NPDC058653 TaxID=3346576 RepID=UPI00365F9A42
MHALGAVQCEAVGDVVGAQQHAEVHPRFEVVGVSDLDDQGVLGLAGDFGEVDAALVERVLQRVGGVLGADVGCGEQVASTVPAGRWSTTLSSSSVSAVASIPAFFSHSVASPASRKWRKGSQLLPSSTTRSVD